LGLGHFTLIVFSFFIISFGFFPNAYAQLTVYENEDYGFSIEYPRNWFVNSTVIEADPIPGFDEGQFSYVFITDVPGDWKYSITVSYIINDNIARHNQGQQYLDRLETRMTENCEVATIDYLGYMCLSHSIEDSKLLEIDGKQAYQVTERWTQATPDGSVYENWSVLTDVVVGNNVWVIDIVTPESDYPNQVSLVNEIIRSFKTKVNGTTCGPGTVFKDGICIPEEVQTIVGLKIGQIIEEYFPIEYIIIVIAAIVAISAALIYLKKSRKPKISKQGDVSKPKFCRKCGSPLLEKEKSCGKCGQTK